MNQKTLGYGQRGVTDTEAASRLAVMLLALMLIAYATARLGGFVQDASQSGTSVVGVFLSLIERTGLLDWFYALRAPFVFISVIVSVVLLAGIIYANRKRAEIRKTFEEEMLLVEQKLAGDALSDKNPRWERVLEMASSESPGDWRVAIIEADAMLEDFMTSMSYHGDTLGDKLKSVEKSDFQTLDLAWEAHKVRNNIAHAGTDFILTSRETKRVIDLYRQVFEEFDYV